MTNPVSLDAERMVEEFQRGDVTDQAASKLLHLFQSGASVEILRHLLTSEAPQAAKAGTWILSELGSGAQPLLLDLPKLLAHDLAYVRFFALDVLLSNEGASNGELVAMCVVHLQDIEGSVRWKARWCLARLGAESIGSSIPYLSSDRLQNLANWLAAIDSAAPTHEDVLRLLNSEDPLERQFGVVAAARLVGTDPNCLEQARSSVDEEIAEFAQDEWKLRLAQG